MPWSLIESAIRSGLKQDPDLICLTGDFITKGLETDSSRYLQILRTLSTAKPTFAVLGNHDGGSWARERGGYSDHRSVDRLLEDAQIELLHNRSRVFDLSSGRMNLVGVGDYWSDEIDAPRAFQSATSEQPTLVLCHNPDACDLPIWKGYRGWIISGHTHGGQVKPPFLPPPFLAVKNKRYTQGEFDVGEGRRCYISTGVGFTVHVRLAVRPEVAVMRMVPA